MRRINTIKKLVSIICLTLITNVHAAEPEETLIVDYKPNCIVEILAPITFNKTALKYQYLGPIEESPAFALALQQLRQDATALGADVMLFTKIRNNKISVTNRTRRKTGAKIRTETSLKMHFEAQPYTLCKDDRSFSNERAPYRADGYVLQTMQHQYTLTSKIITPKKPIEIAQAITLPPANISLATGVYDINLGASTAQTAKKLGPPSIILTLEKNEKIWGYGRHLWFTYSADKLKSVSSELALLTGAGRNSIGFRDGFDDTNWQIEGKVAQKSPIEQVRKSLSQHDIKETVEQITMTQKQQRLILQFDKFHPTTRDNPVTLLTNFTYSSDISEPKKQIMPPLTAAQEQWLYKHLQPDNVELLTLPNLLKQIPQANKINIANDKKQWWLVGNNVQLQFHDMELNQAHISESLFTDSNSDAFFQSVKSLQLPLDKQGMLAFYKDANDNYDEVDITREHFNLIAKFESEEDDAIVYDLVFTYL
ncbi:hypothetical protein JK628_09715 [Shewanella sp. KX20019]|uniref:hypothetical protein n=1 Tax=Shewanella sp. KX20019 TaxID=2803864 RepID=UPI0019284DFF|nr:hypothetical protein [Shewanella sp. KX20019]QQX82056.1 hypothetical protein JK628_09715 [Shewanella sp. KX20019]